MKDRAVAPVVGFALLVAIASIGAMSMSIVALSVIEDTERTITDQQAETAMVETAATTNELRGATRQTAPLSLPVSDGAVVQVNDTAGTMRIDVITAANSAKTVLPNRSLGRIEYKLPDGTQYLYEGGGVWRVSPTGVVEMVRPPVIEYRADAGIEPTLTAELLRISGPTTLADGQGEIRQQETVVHYPNRTTDFQNPLANGSVKLTIESSACSGWETYFRERTSGGITESCAAGQNGSTTGTVPRLVVELVVPNELFTGLEYAAVSGDEIEIKGGGTVDGDTVSGVETIQSASTIVERRFEKTSEDEFGPAHDITSPGPYYFESIEDGVEIDVSGEEPVTVLVDGEINIEGDKGIPVTADEDQIVRVFVDGEVETTSNNVQVGNEEQPTQTRLYVADDVEVNGNAQIDAIVYADGEIDVQTGEITGSLISGDEVAVQSGSATVTYANTASDVVLEEAIGEGNRQIRYLHVAETRLDIED